MKNNKDLINKINLKQLLKEVITGQDYDNPDEFLNKSEKILNFLKNSKNENDRKEYHIILAKIQTDHNLKSLFDYFFKRKRQERLKLFMMMQIQNRGKALKKIKKEKSKNFADEMTEEELEEFEKYKKAQHEAFILFELENNIRHSSNDFIVDLPQYKPEVINDLNEKHFTKNIPSETLSKFDFNTKEINNDEVKSKNSDETKYTNTNSFDKDFNKEKQEQTPVQEKQNEYSGKYTKTFLTLTEAYKIYLLSKPKNTQDKILKHYAENNDINKDFDANEFEKSINFVNFRQNLGLDLNTEDNLNLQQNFS